MATYGRRTISVLDADSELAGSLAAAELEAARLQAIASAFTVPTGEMHPPEWNERVDESVDGNLGFLVVSGLMTRNVTVLGRTSIELVGAGDLLRPWEDDRGDVSMPREVGWSALEPTQLAVLDRGFARRVARWPEIGGTLLDRMFRRVQWLSFHVAILENPRVDARLVLLFWELADRWGRVGPEGVAVPLQLTHQTLGRLIRAQRPSVTASLRQLSDEGLVQRDDDGGWLLLGDVSDHLRALGDG